MDNQVVARFMEQVVDDVRISPAHVSLYVAIVLFCDKMGVGQKVRAFSYQLMPFAKVSSVTTYHKCLKDLHDFGYIIYDPSFNRRVGSKIELINQSKNEK